MLRPVSWCSYVLVLMMWSSWDRIVLSGVICWIWFLGGDRGCVPVNNGSWVAEADMTFMLEIYVLIYNHAVGMCQIVFLSQFGFCKKKLRFTSEWVIFCHFKFELRTAPSFCHKTVWMDVKFLDCLVLSKQNPNRFSVFCTSLPCNL